MRHLVWAIPTLTWIFAAWRTAPMGAPYVALCLAIAALMPLAFRAAHAYDRAETPPTTTKEIR